MLNASMYLKVRLDRPGFTETGIRCPNGFQEKYCKKNIVFVQVKETNLDNDEVVIFLNLHIYIELYD